MQHWARAILCDRWQTVFIVLENTMISDKSSNERDLTVIPLMQRHNLSTQEQQKLAKNSQKSLSIEKRRQIDVIASFRIHSNGCISIYFHRLKASFVQCGIDYRCRVRVSSMLQGRDEGESPAQCRIDFRINCVETLNVTQR